jgi:drug/metabolite transporter (DMT)-like permease
MPLADATAINYLNIPFTAVLANLILKEPYGSAFHTA